MKIYVVIGLLILSLIPIATADVYINDGEVIFHCENDEEEYNVTAPRHFSQIVVDDDWVQFNNTIFNTTFGNKVYTTINFISYAQLPYANLTIVNFSFTQEGNLPKFYEFNISGFLSNQAYRVYTNSTFLSEVITNDTATVNFTTDIYEGFVEIILYEYIIFGQVDGLGGGENETFDEFPLNNSWVFLDYDGYLTQIYFDYSQHEAAPFVDITIPAGQDGIPPYDSFAQTFTVNDSGNLWITNFSILVRNIRGGDYNHNFTYFLVGVNESGIPVDNYVTNYSWTFTEPIMSWEYGHTSSWHLINVTPPVQIDPFTRYAFVILGDPGLTDLYWQENDTDVYKNGTAFEDDFDDEGWVIINGEPGKDFGLRVHGYNDSTVRFVNVTFDWFNGTLGDWEEYANLSFVTNYTAIAFNDNFSSINTSGWRWRVHAESSDLGVEHQEEYHFEMGYVTPEKDKQRAPPITNTAVIGGFAVTPLLLLAYWKREEEKRIL